MFGGRLEVDLDPERLAVEIIDNIEQSKVATVLQLVVHEVHRPCLVDLGRPHQGFGYLPHQAPRRFDSQIQFQLPKNPIHTLIGTGEAFNGP